MNKILYAVAGLCVLASPCSGQVSKLAAAVQSISEHAAEAAPSVRAVSSKALKAQLKMTNQSVAVLQQLNQQKVANVMVDETLNERKKAAVLRQINKEDAALLRDLTAARTAERLAWADALLRERNPNFLPKKDKEIPGLFALSPDLGKYPHMTPLYFREWVRLIPTYNEVPEQFDGLVLALRQRLIRQNQQLFVLNRASLETQRMINASQDKTVTGPLTARKNALDKQIQALSKDAAQCVTDLVHLLNMYPALYNQSLTLLASRLDLTFETPFTRYLRPKIRIPKIDPNANKAPVIRGFRAYEPPLPTEKR